MPTVLRSQGFRFFFYSNEGNEPMHIHVTKAEANGKIWMEPGIEIAICKDSVRAKNGRFYISFRLTMN